jgi:hypothetical protein
VQAGTQIRGIDEDFEEQFDLLSFENSPAAVHKLAVLLN